MDKETIKRKWGKRFSKFFRKTKYLENEYKIVQKDLATSLDISENTITQWKQGKLDIKLTSIYEVVNYIKERFPESTPMLLLFPDLLENEIKRAVNIKIWETIEENEELKKSNYLLNESNTKLNAVVNKMSPKYEQYSKDFKELYQACRMAPQYVKRYFEESLPKDLYFRMF